MKATGPDVPEHVIRNRVHWDKVANDFVASGERAWRLAPGAEHWGIFSVPEADLHLLPSDLTGLDAIELGCGTAYISCWLARRVPPTWRTARRLSSSRSAPILWSASMWPAR